MASSQVEIASSSPFGCVLRDHNGRDGCRESNARATHAVFQENIKNLVRDHLNTCISISSDSAPNEKTQKPISNADTWVSRVARNNLGNLSFTRRNHNIMDKDDSSLSALVSPRHSQILDRWAARQAREMVSLSTLENEVEWLESFPSRSSSFTSRREEYPPRSDGSSETSNLGASSLVQIWEKRLNQSNSTKPNAPASPERSSPNASYNESAFSVEEQCRVSEAGESTDEPQGNEEPFPDWESSDRSYSCSPRWQTSDAAEKERGRVADIIKRLTATNHMQSPLSLSDDNDHELCSSTVTGSSPYRERDRAYAPEQQQPEHRAFAQVTSSPRIRGRRAFNDLLMQLERDRHGEINNLAERGAVSKFTQRGRIQSLLRLRLLQRGVAAYDQSHQKSEAPEVNRQPQGSAIMQLRERFSTGVQHRTSTLAEVSEPRSRPHREIVTNTTQLDNSPTPNQLSKDTRFQTVHGTGIHCTEPTQNCVSQTSVDNKEETRPSSDVTFQRTCSEAQNDDSKEIVEATSSMADSNANEMADKVEASDQQYATAETSYDEMVKEEVTCDQRYAESSYDEIEEEVEASDQNYDEASYDWISHISRPRSYWEERRQEWYREMLDTGSDKEEIRKLIERRTVSTFLSSDFRERMDRLMKSHMGTQTHLVSSQDDEEDNQGRMDQLMAFLQERLRSGGSPREEDGIERVEEEEERRNEEEEEEEEEEKAEEQEEESIISGSDHELGDYSNQSSSSIHTPSHSLLRTWSFRDNEAGDDSDRVAFISSPPPSQSQSFYQDSRQDSSSINHHSIEMELIYDLRGHMEQLFHEMSELRKSIKSCMDMQMQLQQSKNREVHTVEEEKKFHDRTPKKGNCCICYEKKINSLLYRCGHMCACLKCANELQWNSGKCPICRAPIVDVVRVYADTEPVMVDRVSP